MYEQSQAVEATEDSVSVSQQISDVMKGTTMKLSVVKGQPLRSGIQIVTGSMPAQFLLNCYNIPQRNALDRSGYQRRAQDSRVSKLVSQLRSRRVDVPTSILLNVRDEEVAAECLEPDPHGNLALTLSDDVTLYVVDGQHRVLAIKRLCEEDGVEKWGDFQLQFVLLLGADESQEMEQFYVVNSTAKPVRTDLALDLLRQRAESDPDVMLDAVQTGKKWQIDAQAIVDRLSQDSVIWGGRIRLANADKGDTVITSSSFVNSLKPALSSPYFTQIGLENQVKLVDAYWRGIREVFKTPFEADEISNFAIQKGIGVTVLHVLFAAVVEHVRSTGASVFDSGAYRRVLEQVLDRLQGESQNGDPVGGEDFWLIAPRGGAVGAYSSSAGRRVLTAKLVSLLPEMDVE